MSEEKKSKKAGRDKIETSSSIAMQVKNLNELEHKTTVLQRMKNLVRKFAGAPESFQESLDDLIEEHEAEGEKFDPEEKIMLHNIIAFGDMKVGDVMTPRVDIIAINNKTTLDDLKKFVSEKLRTRIPVYRSSLDDIMGFIHIKDMVPYLAGDKPFVIDEILRKILFIPASMQIIELLARMRASRVHMAIVVDEYGGTNGLITMEDLMEEIVGEINDEHDEATADYNFQKINNMSFEVSPRMPVDMLEEKIGMKISSIKEKDDYDTIGGLIFFSLGRVPKIGEVVQHRSGLEFAVVDADARKIKKLLVRKSTKAAKGDKSKIV